MAKSGYIPGGDNDFDAFFNQLVIYAMEKITGQPSIWNNIPVILITALASQYSIWHIAFEKTKGPHTSVDTEAKNDARKVSEALIRPFVNQYLRFDPVTNEDRTAMGINNKDGTRTTIGAPTTRPSITDMRALGGFQIEICFRDEATPESRAIPYGDSGCLLFYTVSDGHITDYAMLEVTALMTRSPFVITLPPEAEGKRFTCAARWQNRKGEKGPWGEIKTIIIV
jgi:hypothetical protein